MRSNLGTLLKAELNNHIRMNALLRERDLNKKNKSIALAAILLILYLMLGGYCFILANTFGKMNLSKVIPGYALSITSLITLFFTFTKTNGVLFGTKDYDMLMAFPIKSSTIITSKFLSMYILNLVFTLAVMIPMAIAYGMYNTVTPFSLLSWVLGSLLAPLFPMTIAAILGAIIIGIGSSFQHKVFVQMVLSIALVISLFTATYQIQKASAQDKEQLLSMLADLGKTISNQLHQIYPLSKWFDLAVNEKNLLSLALFIGISLVIYGSFALLTGHYYFKMNSMLNAHHTTSHYKIEKLKSRSMMYALIVKEWKRFTSSAVYMMNTGIGLLFALLFSCS